MSWKRAKDRNFKLKRLREHTRQSRDHAIWVERDEATGRWRVFVCYSQGTKKYLRQRTNRRVRHAHCVASGSQFKKFREFWCDIW